MDADSTQKELSAILDEIEERANKATEGPWFTAHDDLEAGPHTNSGLALLETGRNEDWWPARLCEWPTAEFIASARTDVPALVQALRRAEQTFQFEINRGNDWSSLNARDALRDITAILNQGRSVGDNKGSAT